MARTSWLWRTDVTARSPTDCEHDGSWRFSRLPTAHSRSSFFWSVSTSPKCCPWL